MTGNQYRDLIIDQGTCLGTGDYRACLPSPGAARTIPGGTLNTSNSPLCSAIQPADWASKGQPSSCFIVATNISSGGNIIVTGNRPLVLFASQSITLTHMLDAASHRGGSTGPAGNQSCGLLFSAGSGEKGGGGGAGASFMTRGGDGGDGDDDNGGDGGISAIVIGTASAPTRLRGGCTGGRGGRGGNNNGGNGGSGGGAVYLVAGTSIGIGGVTINVSGAGGNRGNTRAGGGGGGSGGMLKLDAPSITVNTSTRILANGGGGGSGGSKDSSGADGQDPNPASPTTPASGGSDGGGNGGRGHAVGSSATRGQDGEKDEGGGGGGGGGGYVQSNRPLTGASVSAGRIDVP